MVNIYFFLNDIIMNSVVEKFNKINHSSDWTIIEPNPITKKNIKAKYLLQNNRKFDLKLFKILKDKEYVEKIIV